ncbi:MAG: alpha/beta hydrolase [Candidatus Neomarinimicrobiota bacterium]|nr:alpha/beta hydrolase [Candidatus Neomarinimicrobiota bacterium]
MAKIPDNAVLIKKLSGTLEVMGAKLPLVFNVYQSPVGNLIGSMDSPVQGAYGISVKNVTITDANIVFNVSSIGGKYEGIQTGPDQYEGDWTQGGKSFPLNIAPLKRPQEPKDFFYKVEDITFTNSKAGIKLAGTLTTPEGDGPFPVVVLISGSGPQNRDEELMGHKPFLVLSDYITRNGIAVLGYDDRGVGDSEGDFSTATSFDFANDADAAVAYLKSNFDFSAIGLAGHSEGGVIAPIVANQSKDVDFIILMAGSSLTGKKILDLQGALILGQTEISREGLEVYIKTQSTMLQIAVEIENNEEALKILSVVSKAYGDLSEQDQQIIGYNPETFEAALKALLSPWMRTFLTYDPRLILEQVTIPVLAINGEKDLQVPPKENLSEIKAALERGENTDHEIHELKNLNHLFQTCETGAIGEYGTIEETFNKEAMDLMTQWILKKVHR